MEIQESNENAEVEDINVHEYDVTSVELFDEIVLITNECHVSAPSL